MEISLWRRIGVLSPPFERFTCGGLGIGLEMVGKNSSGNHF